MFITNKRHEAEIAAKDSLLAEKDRTIAEVIEYRDMCHKQYLDTHAENDRLRAILAKAYVRDAKGRMARYVEGGEQGS